jgi:hypothetical protein
MGARLAAVVVLMVKLVGALRRDVSRGCGRPEHGSLRQVVVVVHLAGCGTGARGARHSLFRQHGNVHRVQQARERADTG